MVVRTQWLLVVATLVGGEAASLYVNVVMAPVGAVVV